MNVGELSKLEYDVMLHILSTNFGKIVAQIIISKLIVKERNFNTGSYRPDMCSASYTYFEKINIDDLHLGKLDYSYFAPAEHPLYPKTGGCFSLFTTETPFDFLELSFYSEDYPIDLITSEQHGFTIIVYDNPDL